MNINDRIASVIGALIIEREGLAHQVEMLQAELARLKSAAMRVEVQEKKAKTGVPEVHGAPA